MTYGGVPRQKVLGLNPNVFAQGLRMLERDALALIPYLLLNVINA